MRYLLALAFVSAAVLWGNHQSKMDKQRERRSQSRYLNRLIADGFKVIDPEGFEIDHFDEEDR